MDQQVEGKLMLPVGVVLAVVIAIVGGFAWLDREINAEVKEEVSAHNLSIHPATTTAISKLEVHLVNIEALLRDTRDRVIKLER
jgi:hypothetical protein